MVAIDAGAANDMCQMHCAENSPCAVQGAEVSWASGTHRYAALLGGMAGHGEQ